MSALGICSILTTWCIFGVYCFSQYSDQIRSSQYFWFIGIGYGLVANTLWVLLAKHIGDSSKIVAYAVAWDAGIALLAFAIPSILLRHKISVYTVIGLALMATGTIITIVSQNLTGGKS